MVDYEDVSLGVQKSMQLYTGIRFPKQQKPFRWLPDRRLVQENATWVEPGVWGSGSLVFLCCFVVRKVFQMTAAW